VLWEGTQLVVGHHRIGTKTTLFDFLFGKYQYILGRFEYDLFVITFAKDAGSYPIATLAFVGTKGVLDCLGNP